MSQIHLFSPIIILYWGSDCTQKQIVLFCVQLTSQGKVVLWGMGVGGSYGLNSRADDSPLIQDKVYCSDNFVLKASTRLTNAFFLTEKCKSYSLFFYCVCGNSQLEWRNKATIFAWKDYASTIKVLEVITEGQFTKKIDFVGILNMKAVPRILS